MNRSSSVGGNVAVNMTMGTCALFNSPNSCNRGRKSRCSFNTTWHSSMTIRSNRSCPRNRLMNRIKSSLRLLSGVTNTIRALSGGLRRFHSRQSMPDSRHLRCKSCRNAINGTTTYDDRLIPDQIPCDDHPLTMVTPPSPQNAGNINNKLFPPPVGMMANIRSWPLMMDSTTLFCDPRNSA